MLQNSELKDLLTLAETDKEAACEQFIEKYGINRISYFDHFHYCDKKLGYKINPNINHIDIENFDVLKRFLLYFGRLINEIKIVCDVDSSFKWNDMIKMIQSNCPAVKNLHFFSDISADDPMEVFMKKIARAKNISHNPLCLTESFPLIENLKIENIHLDPSIKIDELFPNLRTLDLFGIVTSDPSFIEVHMPNMEHMGITLETVHEFSLDEEDLEFDERDEIAEENCNECSGEDENHKKARKGQFNWVNIQRSFSLNPQLQSVFMDMIIYKPMVEFVTETLPNLQKIQISFAQNDFDAHNRKEKILFKNVISASLGHLGINLPPLTFEKLEHLDFTTNAHQSAIDFVSKQQNLKCLDLSCEYTELQAFRMVKALPNLKHLYMIIGNQIKWSARGLMRFLTELERLDTLMLMLAVDSNDQSNWQSLLSTVWFIQESYNQDNYTIEKNDSINSSK